MRFIHVGKDGHAYRVRGDDESVSAISYQKSGGSGFVECFGIGEGYLRLKNTATASLPAAPDEGALVYDETLKAPVYHDGTEYKTVAGASFGLEEKDWAPALWDTSNSDGEGQTYFNQRGRATRIGRLVLITGSFQVSDIGTLTTGNAAHIGNLPYTPSADANASGAGISIHSAQFTGTYSLGDVVTGSIGPGQTYIRLRVWSSATGLGDDLLISAFDSSTFITFSGIYTV